MSKHIMINGTSANWRLAEATDLEGLRKTLETAMESGAILQLPVYLSDDETAPVTMLLNASQAVSIVLVEL